MKGPNTRAPSMVGGSGKKQTEKQTNKGDIKKASAEWIFSSTPGLNELLRGCLT